MRKVFTFKVEVCLDSRDGFESPEDYDGIRVNKKDVGNFVKCAVGHWGGHMYSEHPFFPSNIRVRVTGIPENTKRKAKNEP